MANYNVIARLSANVSDFQRGMKQAESSLRTFKQQTGSSMERIGSTMQGIGKALTLGVTVPLVGMAGVAMKVGAEYEASMSKVQAISGATGSEMQQLENVAREMGATTRYSASEAADALSYMALAGWDTERMVAALPSVLNLATAGQLDLAQASDIVTDMMSMFGMEADEASRATDVFAAAQANSNTSVEQLGEALKNTGSMAAAAGQSLEDTSAVLGILADNGIKGGEAGTALNAMFMDLQNAAKDGAVAIGDSSVAIYDAEGNMRSIVDIMKDFESATEGMTQEQRNNELASIFQRRSLKGVNTIMNEGTDSLVDLQNELYNSNGAAENMAATMDDNLQGSFYNLRSALEEVALSFMDFAGGPIRTMIDAITDLVRWFGNLDPAVQQWIAIIAAVAAAIGPIIFVIGTLVIWFVKVKVAVMALLPLFSGLGIAFVVMAAKIIAIIAIIGALIAAGVWLYQNWDTVREKAIAIWSAIASYLSSTWQSIKAQASAIWSSITQVMSNNWNITRNFTISVWNSIRSTLASLWNGIRSQATSIFNSIRSVVTSIWNAIRSITSSVWNGIRSLITSILNSIRSTFTSIFNSLRGIVSNAFSAVRSAVMSGMQSALGAVTSFFGRFRSAGSNIVSNIANGIRGAVGKVTSAMRGVLSAARNLLPFSPPKDKSSPLVDIHKNGIGTQIAAGIMRGQREVDKAMHNLLENPANLAMDTGVHQQVTHSLDGTNSNIMANINLRLGNNDYQAFVEDISSTQQSQSRLNRY